MDGGKGDDAKMCRLCGQYERIYIDVFGEEGVKRFLGRKIHTKINIQISEHDGLPQQICRLCMAKIKFVDDFCTSCHNVQIKLTADIKQEKKRKYDAANDAEANKENTAPSAGKWKKRRTSNTGHISSSLTNLDTMSKLDESQEKNPVRNYLYEIEPAEPDVKKELDIKEECANEEESSSCCPNNPMVWIPSSNLPAHEPDRFEQGASKESLLEKADEREDLESNEADVPNDPKSSMTVLDLPEVTPSESDPNLSGVVNQQNAITNPSLVSPSSSCNNNDRKPRITELMTKEQKQMIEQYYKIDMSIVDKEKVQSHMTVREKANIECNICSFKYSRRDKCEVHIWGHFNMKPYQCTACIFATVTLSNIRCHIRKNHLKLKPYLCQQCTKRYTSSVLLQEHMNTHTGARPYKCGECNFASSSRQALSNHKDTHKLNNNLPCSVCNKSFSSRVRLRAHKRIHNANRIMCELCRVHLLSEKALEEHRKKVHSQDYICNVCQKTFKSRKALHNHMNVHAEAKYKCNICLNTYKSKHILSEHILKHEGIRKYNCSVCDKTFAQMSHLAAHKKVHGSPGYKCEGCKREFNRRDNMKIHMKRCVACKALPA